MSKLMEKKIRLLKSKKVWNSNNIFMNYSDVVVNGVKVYLNRWMIEVFSWKLSE